MRLVGIRRKSDGEIIMAVHMGQSYRLPDGLTMKDVDVVPITVPEVPKPREYTLEELEEIKKMLKQSKEENERLEQMAQEQGMGVGDLIAKLTKTFGIKPCASCEQRRKVANKMRVVGWKIKWVKGDPEIDS